MSEVILAGGVTSRDDKFTFPVHAGRQDQQLPVEAR